MGGANSKAKQSEIDAAKSQMRKVEEHIKWCIENGYTETANKETELLLHWQRWVRKRQREALSAKSDRVKGVKHGDAPTQRKGGSK